MTSMSATVRVLRSISCWLLVWSCLHPQVHAVDTAGLLELAPAPNGTLWAVSDVIRNEVILLQAETDVVRTRIPLPEGPAGLAWSSSSDRLYVAERRTGDIVEVDLATGSVRHRARVARRPSGIALSANGAQLYICDSATDAILALDLASGAVQTLPVNGHQPQQVEITPEGHLVVLPLLPQGAADPAAGLQVTILDPRRSSSRVVSLPAGSTAGRGLALSPDGRLAAVSHVIARANLPTIIADAGWVNTNAISLIDVQMARLIATVALDRPSVGAADPWGVAFADGGATLWVAASGVHAFLRIDITRLRGLISGEESVEDPTLPQVWRDMRRDPALVMRLADDLTALAGAGLVKRIALPHGGPRGLAITPDQEPVTTLYFGGSLAHVQRDGEIRQYRLSANADLDPIRQGERIFHDGSATYQGWLSCATCHVDGRSDGLNWDRLNDGVGNPKNTRSLIGATHRAPAMALGVYPDAQAAIAAGFQTITFRDAPEEDIAAVVRYLAAQQPEPSPWLDANGKRSEAAERGRLLFEGTGDCISCHKGTWRSDFKRHRIGTGRGLDTGKAFTTPILTELWRTPPYLHDGSAATLRAIFQDRNPEHAHGEADQLTEAQLDDLIWFLLSL